MLVNYILKGKEPIPCEDIHEWGEWMAVADRTVLKTVLEHIDDSEKRVGISTVFLGVDHRFDKGPPILFETMVFGGPMDGEMNRYCTWEQAEQGHNSMVQQVIATGFIPLLED